MHKFRIAVVNRRLNMRQFVTVIATCEEAAVRRLSDMPGLEGYNEVESLMPLAA